MPAVRETVRLICRFAASTTQPRWHNRGDEVLVAPGVYREYVNPVHAGTEDARISYRSTRPLGAVITGAEQAKNWEVYDGNVWVCRISNSIFGGYNPYTTFVYGDWYFAKADKHTGCVYLNDKALYETASLSDCIKGEVYECSWMPEESVYKWYTEQDEAKDETIIYANFQGKDPNKENVEINVRRECFLPSKTRVGYITVSGFQITKAATTWAPPAAFQDGMIGPHWSKGWIIEDCDISNSKCAGISLGKYPDPENEHYFTSKYVKSATQMERDAGTWMFDDYPTYDEWISQFDFTKPADLGKLEPVHFGRLPVWTEGDAYLGGARACKNEVNGFIAESENSCIRIDLVEKDGAYYLDTNIYEFLTGFSDRTINTDVLGKAFEPEERFENPDGTPIQFDADYFGRHRGTDVIPGPFASAADPAKALY